MMNDFDSTQPPTDLDLLKKYLAQRDEQCPLCGYNLRSLKGEACPECGKELVLRVGLREPNLGAYVTGIVALASATGFNVLLLGYMLLAFMVSSPVGIGAFILANAVGAVLGGGALYAWIKNGRRVRQLPRLKGRLLGAFTFLVPVLSLLLFFWVAWGR